MSAAIAMSWHSRSTSRAHSTFRTSASDRERTATGVARALERPRARARRERRSTRSRIARTRATNDSSEDSDSAIARELERELRLRGKIYRAEAALEEAKGAIADAGDSNKTSIDNEASLVRDRTSLELGMVAGELDRELEAMAEEAKAARERNATVKRELEALAEELLGTKPRERKALGKAVEGDSISEFKARQAEEEADRVGARMQATLEDTQRASSFTLVLLLLSITAVSLLAEGAYDKFFAVGGAIALIAYQARAESARREERNKKK